METLESLKEALDRERKARMKLEAEIAGAKERHARELAGIKKNDAMLVRSEEKYRLLIENMNLGLLEVDLEGRILYANQSFCRMSGYEKEEIYGKIAEVLFTHPDNYKVVSEKNESRKKGISDAYELEITMKNGQKKWWLISGAPLYNSEGKQIGSTGIHLDITGQKQLEFTLREAKQMAEDTARAKEVFLANMSHEIRTPMNAILGLGKQLLKTEITTHQKTFLDAINGASENLLVVINDILDFSKIESGKLDLEKISFGLEDLLSQISMMMKQKAEEKGLDLILNIDSSIAKYHLGDPFRINQILLNLLSNSIKFTEQGKVSLSCRVMNNRTDCQTIKLSVSDTGIGIDEKYLEDIFKKFSQESVNTARKFGGTGLGMAITKQLVDLMDGKISIESKKNLGTRIDILLTLPLGSVSKNRDKETFAPVCSKKLQGRKILLVDDNKLNRLVAATILQNYGAVVIEAFNGEQAVDYLRKNTVDAVLMDIQMPVMDGITASIIIRLEIHSTMPVIALTAHALKAEEERCMNAGMNDFITKPFEEEKLISTILKHVS